MPLPRFGIKEPVRVCESCFLKNGKVDAPAGYVLFYMWQ